MDGQIIDLFNLAQTNTPQIPKGFVLDSELQRLSKDELKNSLATIDSYLFHQAPKETLAQIVR